MGQVKGALLSHPVVIVVPTCPPTPTCELITSSAPPWIESWEVCHYNRNDGPGVAVTANVLIWSSLVFLSYFLRMISTHSQVVSLNS